MSVKQVNLGNFQRKLYKRLNSSFLCSGFPKMSKPKTKTVGIWTGERSSCSVTKLYNYSETNYPFKSKHWSKMCKFNRTKIYQCRFNVNYG